MVSATNADEYVLAPATLQDIEAISRLLRQNSASKGGWLQGNFPQEKVAKMLVQPGAFTVVAKRNNSVVAVLFGCASFHNLPAVAAGMLRAWPPGERCWLYGPVCINASERGKGLLRQLYENMCHHYAGVSPVLFIQADNLTSIRAHQQLGMQEMARFTSAGKHFLVYTHSPSH